MAFAMTTQGNASVFNRGVMNVSGVIPPVQIADKTFTTAKTSTAAQNLTFGVTRIRVTVYLKTLVLGANTNAQQGPIFYVEAADNSGMTTNLTVLGGIIQGVNIASATEVQVLMWDLMPVPVASKQFVQVTVDPTLMGAGSSGTFDALIEATP